MKHFSHLNTAVQLMGQYKGELPFGIFLKSFFAQHKKYGSKDRKRIGHLCYCYFRLGYALNGFSAEEKTLAGVFLCSQQPDELLLHLKPGWNRQMQLSIDEKIAILNEENISFSLHDIFPWKESLSEGIDHEPFCRSFLVQPDLFVRLRPGHEKTVKQKLNKAGINFNEASPGCLSFLNSSKINAVIDLDRETVIQDLNSQNTGSFLTSPNGSLPANYTLSVGEEQLQTSNYTLSGAEGPTSPKEPLHTNPLSAWDCCAASGGKSILAYDLIPGIELTVSDVRESIIHNLKGRFAKAGIKNYHAFVADLSTADHKVNPGRSRTANFDLIICDAPCTGSGTWSRTPEQLLFHDHDKAQDHYSTLQKNIAANIIPYLKKGGRLVYITCSVFKKENEEAVRFIQDKFSLQLERMEVLKGYDKRADTLFAASFTGELIQ